MPGPEGKILSAIVVLVGLNGEASNEEAGNQVVKRAIRASAVQKYTISFS